MRIHVPHFVTTRSPTFRAGLIKGRMAEVLVRELFTDVGYTVIPNGMENIPGVNQLLEGLHEDVSRTIRHKPDLIVQDPLTRESFYIEVKFRKNGEFRYEHLPDRYAYRNAYVILVSKKHIKCLSVEELASGIGFTARSQHYLADRNEFNFDRKLVIEYCEFAAQIFAKVK